MEVISTGKSKAIHSSIGGCCLQYSIMVKKNYKSKGRQQSNNNGYDDGGSYKSLRAIHQHELNNAINDTIRWTRQERETAWTQERQKQQNKERPRFSFDATNNSLRHIVRDRKLEDSYFLRERRRRNGFLLPSINTTTTTTTHYSTTDAEGEGLVHPPGWILRYNNNDNNNYNEESSSSSSSSSSLSDSYNNNNNVNVNVNVVQKLQTLSLTVFSNYIHDYQHVMGSKTLQTIVSLLSSNCLMELSILLCTSSTGTTNDDLAVLLGQHSHVERLCLRGSSNGNGGDSRSASATTTRSTNLTDAGLLKLIPKTTILQRRRRQKQQQQQQQQHRQYNDDKNNKKDNNEDDNDNESILECWEEEVDEDDADDDDEYDHDDNAKDNDHVDHTECHDDDDNDYADEEEEGNDNNNNNNNNNGTATSSSVIIDGIVGSLKLRRLELLDLVVSCGSGSSSSREDGIICGNSRISSSISADVILRWFDKCSGITHLSLAGSFYLNNNSSWSIGRTIVLELHKVLPYLEVLDITRCPWVTESLIIRFLEGHCTNNNNKEAVAASKKTTSSQSSLMMSSLPIVYYNRGRFTLNEKQKQHLLNSQQQHQNHQDTDAAHDDWW